LWARAAYLRLRFKKKQVSQGDFKRALYQIVVQQYAQLINKKQPGRLYEKKEKPPRVVRREFSNGMIPYPHLAILAFSLLPSQ
jgi:hypothetical protein